MPRKQVGKSLQRGQPFVLIMEPDAAIRELLVRCVRDQAGLNPVPVTSSREAEQVVRGVLVEAIIVDASWDDTGAIIKSLRAELGGTGAIAIVMTTQGNATRLLASGADLVVQKPFSPLGLAGQLRAALGLRPLLASHERPASA